MKIYYLIINNCCLNEEENEYSKICYFNIYNKLIINKFLKIIIVLVLLSIKNINSYNDKIIVEIDNKINESIYENDLDFSKYTTEIKIIAIYYPEFININNNIYKNKKIEEEKIVDNSNFLFNYQKQRLKAVEGIENINISESIKRQIKLAKKHGIYGFGINYYWFSGIKIYDEVINIFLENKEINFPFFIIWKNNIFNDSNIIIEQKYNLNNSLIFINDIKKYLISDNYIKINEKPILAIYEPIIIPNLTEYLYYLRFNANKCGIRSIFIIGALNDLLDNNYTKLFDSFYEFPPKNINLDELIKNEIYYYYTGLIYRGNFKYNNNTYNFDTFRGVMLECDYPQNNEKPLMFGEYSPEKFFIIIKLLINWTKYYLNKNYYFIFINAWNNWKEGFCLEPDDKFGYSSLNALSKALFNLSYNEEKINLIDLANNCKVAIQIHIFYLDLINEIINKTNNIPIKYDLFISTTYVEIKDIILENIKKYSKADKYEIIIINNKGRDVLPFLTQLKNKIKKYKYICHIHSKKSKTSPNIGISWRIYLFNNLLGNTQIVSEILSNFENNEKLGFIFPETFYEVIKHSLILTKKTKKYMNYILKKLFPNHEVGIQLIFPAGNMFWARVNAIYQVFEINFNKLFDKEQNQVNDTIMHGIERIWLYLVKLNGYYYKTIFKSFY